VTTNFDAVFIGAGPVGLSALIEYVNSGLHENQRILLVYPKVTLAESIEEIIPKTDRENLEHLRKFATRRFKQYVQTGSYSKGKSFSLDNQRTIESLSYHWGASCFPYPEAGRKLTTSESDVQFKIARRWNIQAELDALSDLYPINGEVVGKLKRKKLSEKFSLIGNTIDGAVIGHSRLAISTSGESGCEYCNRCFEGCPISSPWNPDNDIQIIKSQFPQVAILRGSVSSLRWDGKSYEIHTQQGTFACKSVYLGAGWENSLVLLSNLMGLHLDPNEVVKQSNVLIRPFILLRREKSNDYFNSFVYHDNVMVTLDANKSVDTFTQIYFPTIDLWMRILSQAPSFLHKILGFVIRSLSFMSSIGRHFGVAMIFFPGDDWNSDVEVNMRKRKVQKNLNSSLHCVSGFLIPGLVKKLYRGQSQHVGAIDPQLASFIEKNYPNLYLVSPLNLDKIVPGPHTFYSAVLAATTVVKSRIN
jgi:hypothetical protein